MSDGRRDFFVSFNSSDRTWATWIAWVLEENGYSVWFQDWDFRGNFVEHMNRAHAQAHRTLAVLSEHYFGSDFTLAEWSARFAQDPVAREDRLVPVKVGSLSGESILGPIVYADLIGCDEEEARRRLLGRVRKAVDVGYRNKPAARPGFPNGLPREVPAKPSFPTAEVRLGADERQEGWAVAGDRSVSIGRDMIGGIVSTGDDSRISARIDARVTKTTLLPAGSVDIGQELASIRTVLTQLGGEQAGKVGRALDDAQEEARRPEPDRDEIGRALERALDYARKTGGFAEEAAKLVPHLRNAVGWLGGHWHKLLPLVSLVA